jgi:hypothetical protein
MSSITYGLAPTESAETSVTAPAAPRKGFFARLMAQMMAARQRQAMDELRRHNLLLPHELEAAGWKLTERSEDSLPFRR